MAEIDEVTVFGSNKWSKLKPIDLSIIEPVDFPEEEYHPYEFQKKQIVEIIDTVSDSEKWSKTDTLSSELMDIDDDINDNHSPVVVDTFVTQRLCLCGAGMARKAAGRQRGRHR